jgi:hypothetical protein
VVALPCEAIWELEYHSGFVYMDPLWLGGIKGKKSTASVAWEVLVKSQRLARLRSGVATPRNNIFDFDVCCYGSYYLN